MLPGEMDTIMALPHIVEELFFLIRLVKREGSKCLFIFGPAMTHPSYEKLIAFAWLPVVQFRNAT